MLSRLKYPLIYFCVLFFVVASAAEPLAAPQIYQTSEPNQLRNAMEQSIEKAEKSILIFTYSFSDSRFIELLNQKADEGVEVVVIIDKSHTLPLSQSASSSVELITRQEGEGRVHHKILVTDEEEIWLGSANFTRSAFASQDNMVVRLKSRALARSLRQEAEVFQGLRRRSYAPPALSETKEAQLFLLPHFEPKERGPEKQINEEGKKELVRLIRNAKSHIRIAMMVWTDPELEKEILQAHRSGVTVEILMQDLDSVTQNLQREGVFVTKNPHLSFMHNKWMWIDDTILVNGSANWSRSSFSRNDESFLVLTNLTPQQQSEMEEYWVYLLTR